MGNFFTSIFLSILAYIAMVIGIGFLMNLGFLLMTQNEDLEAYCNSIEGEYGGGKCFKDGQEMKYED